MLKTNIKEMRSKISGLIDSVVHGEEVTVYRRGKPVAKIVPYLGVELKHPPSMKAFREKIKIKGSLLDALLEEREEQRF